MKVTIEVPPVAFKGPEQTDADYYHDAATRLRGNYPVGGSNLREAIAQLLDAVVKELEA